MSRNAAGDPPLFADEVGNVYSVLDDIVLTAAYAPVWRRRGAAGALVGMRGSVQARKGGRAVSVARLAASGCPGTLSDSLLISNRANLPPAARLLFLPPPPLRRPDWAATLARRQLLADAALALEPCGGGSILHEYTTAQAASGAPGEGAACALTGFDGEAALVDTPCVAVIAISMPWLRRIARSATALSLLASFTRLLAASGREVMVGGIETRRDLEAAMAIRAALLAGPLLGASAPVGMSVDEEIDLDALLPGRAVVLPFAPPTHRRG